MDVNGYFVTDDEEGDALGFVIIADSFKDAKGIAYKSDEFSQCCDFEELTGWKLHGGDLSGLENGTVVGLMDGLERGIYPHILFEDECPTCHEDTLYLMYNKVSKKCYCENDNCPARPYTENKQNNTEVT